MPIKTFLYVQDLGTDKIKKQLSDMISGEIVSISSGTAPIYVEWDDPEEDPQAIIDLDDVMKSLHFRRASEELVGTSDDWASPNEVTSVETKADLETIKNLHDDRTAYVRELNISFVDDGNESAWKQAGENTILQDGLVKGAIFVNELKVG